MSFGVATLRAVVHAGDKTSEDARSWYMISGDAKSWVCVSKVILLSICHAALVVLHDALRALVVDTESEPEEAPSEIEELQSLGSRVPLMGKEFKTVEPSGTRTDSSHSSSSSDSTTPLSPDHPLTYVSPTPPPTRASFHRRTTRMTVHVQPAMSLGYSARVTEYGRGIEMRMTRERESQGLGDKDHGLDDESQGLEDKGLGLEGEEVVPKGQQQAVPVVETAASEPLGLGYGALRHRELTVEEDQVPSTFVVGQSSRSVSERQGAERTPPFPEWSLGFLPVSPSSPVVPSPKASLVATPIATISIDEDQFIEAAMQRQLQEMRGRVTALEKERDRREQ
ncbi:hypothetical protein Tco_0697148 [Tanacetum coccineum]